MATITGAAGGTFSATGGLTVDPNTGEIDLSTATAGNYQISWHASKQLTADAVKILMEKWVLLRRSFGWTVSTNNENAIGAPELRVILVLIMVV